MTTAILISMVVPVAAVVLFLAARRGLERPADERGIALQTIIVMVVLLAIAGAVAAVLLNRAGSETDRLENETVNFTDYETKFGCDTVDGTWTANSTGDRMPTGDDAGEWRRPTTMTTGRRYM